MSTMETTLIDWLHQLGTLEFWEALLEGFEGLGPLVPILLAMVESIFPPLPLIAIVALNVAAHGDESAWWQSHPHKSQCLQET